MQSENSFGRNYVVAISEKCGIFLGTEDLQPLLSSWFVFGQALVCLTAKRCSRRDLCTATCKTRSPFTLRHSGLA